MLQLCVDFGWPIQHDNHVVLDKVASSWAQIRNTLDGGVSFHSNYNRWTFEWFTMHRSIFFLLRCTSTTVVLMQQEFKAMIKSLVAQYLVGYLTDRVIGVPSKNGQTQWFLRCFDFWGNETVSQFFPTAPQNTVESRFTTTTKTHKNLALWTPPKHTKTSLHEHLGEIVEVPQNILTVTQVKS